MDDTQQPIIEEGSQDGNQAQEEVSGGRGKTPEGRRDFFKLAAAAAVGMVGATAASAAQADAQAKSDSSTSKDCTPTAFGRRTKFAVVPIAAMRVNNIRSDDEVVRAQATVTPEMISALEEMVNAAKAGRLNSENALGIAALAW